MPVVKTTYIDFGNVCRCPRKGHRLSGVISIFGLRRCDLQQAGFTGCNVKFYCHCLQVSAGVLGHNINVVSGLRSCPGNHESSVGKCFKYFEVSGIQGNHIGIRQTGFYLCCSWFGLAIKKNHKVYRSRLIHIYGKITAGIHDVC